LEELRELLRDALPDNFGAFALGIRRFRKLFATGCTRW
jgi:hypothetical protein